MIITLSSIFIIFLSFIITILLIPKLKIIAIKNNLLDNPNERKIHQKSISNLGGIGIYLGSFFSIALLYIIICRFLNISFEKNDLLLFILGPFLLTLLGFFDDLFNINYKIRLAIQFFISVLIYIFLLKVNFYIDLTWISGNKLFVPAFLSFSIAILWISGMVNAINWFDGIDGLASSTSVLFSLGLIIIALDSKDYLALFFLTSLIGSNLGFLKHNWRPARIFMGDSGSNFLGFSLAITSLYILKDLNNNISLNILLLFFLIPILDMTIVILNRLKNKRSPFLPDNSHIHYRLLNTGLSVPKTVLIINFLTQIFMFLSLTLTVKNNWIIFFIFLLILNLFLLFQKSFKLKT